MWLLVACETDETPSYEVEDLDAELEGYEDWSQHPDWVGVRPSCEAAHGEYVQIWLNAIAVADIEAESEAFSEGAILVLEGYQDEGLTPHGLEAMRKLPGFDPDFGDWFWGHYDEDEVAVATGRVTGCLYCHDAEARDHVLFLDSVVASSVEECP